MKKEASAECSNLSQYMTVKEKNGLELQKPSEARKT